MRVLFLGDSPTVTTGFARCTRTACDALHAAGHDVTVLGIHYYGRPHDFPYTIEPCREPLDNGNDVFGTGRLPVLTGRLNPDVIVLTQDPWSVKEYMDYFEECLEENRKAGDHLTADRLSTIPWVGWLAVDGENYKGQELNRLTHVVTWCDWAKRQLAKDGCTVSTSVVPLGVDHSLFYPHPRDESRRRLLDGILPDNAFIIGVVGRNQPRKRLDLALQYFADLYHSGHAPNAYLYMHVAPTGEKGFDLRQLADYYQIRGRIISCEQKPGKEVRDADLPYMYSALDVKLSTTQGEGWDLTTHEAMACGVPCVVPHWSALGDWPGTGVITIPCTSTAITGPLNRTPYTIGGVPDRRTTVDQLQALYDDRGYREAVGQRGLAKAQEFSWGRTGKEMVEVLEAVVGNRQSVGQEEVA